MGGFSQGACLSIILCLLKSINLLPENIKFSFACIFSGYLPKDKELNDKFKNININIPTFHCYGENDNIINSKNSEDVIKYFSDPIIIKHNKGHLIPSDKIISNRFKEFINTKII